MSNRNNKSKSPQLKKPVGIDKDLMKYLILQKITKPQAPAELITKTQPDEDSEVEDFKQEIESKFKMCRVNQSYKFPMDCDDQSSDNSLESLQGVTVYNLNCDNLERLTDASQPHFMKALNEKLSKLTELFEEQETPPFKSVKQHNYAPVLKSSRLQKVRGQNLSNTSINRVNEMTVASQGRESVNNNTTKPPSNLGFRQTPTLSSDKKSKQKQIQQILKIAQQQKQSNFYKRTPQINNNYVNISANINNSVIITGKRNLQDIRVKTECDEGELSQFQVFPKSRPKMRESTMKNKKIELPQGHKILNYTMDNQLLEQLGIQRNAKSQNKNYKA